jgi:hypothetical protein
MSDYVIDYVRTILNGIEYANRYYNRGQFFEALDNLLPVIALTKVYRKEDQEKLQQVEDTILEIPSKALGHVTASTRARKRYEHNLFKNKYARKQYLEALKIIRDAINDPILRRKLAFNDESPDEINWDDTGTIYEKPE